MHSCDFLCSGWNVLAILKGEERREWVAYMLLSAKWRFAIFLPICTLFRVAQLQDQGTIHYYSLVLPSVLGPAGDWWRYMCACGCVCPSICPSTHAYIHPRMHP